MSRLIQKSVRLPEELVAYVETKRGVSFSGKLVRLLEGCREQELHPQRFPPEQVRSVTSTLDIAYRQNLGSGETLGRLMSELQDAGLYSPP